MAENTRDDFLKRLSTVGFGARESVQVMLANLVYDVRERVVRKRFRDEEMDQVVAFHDEAEKLWGDVMATDPLLDPDEMVSRLKKLLSDCEGPLAQYERKLAHGVHNAEEFAKSREK
jgi:hypothetical protein